MIEFLNNVSPILLAFIATLFTYSVTAIGAALVFIFKKINKNVMDAMLGAAALGDIGRHFPDTDPAYKGADSRVLLAACREKIASVGYRVHNIDALICAQAPKMAPHIAQMRANIAVDLGVDEDAVNVKATTTEHLGFEGEELGISAHAVCLLETLSPEPR